jgi:hypothetical protein
MANSLIDQARSAVRHPEAVAHRCRRQARRSSRWPTRTEDPMRPCRPESASPVGEHQASYPRRLSCGQPPSPAVDHPPGQPGPVTYWVGASWSRPVPVGQPVQASRVLHQRPAAGRQVVHPDRADLRPPGPNARCAEPSMPSLMPAASKAPPKAAPQYVGVVAPAGDFGLACAQGQRPIR